MALHEVQHEVQHHVDVKCKEILTTCMHCEAAINHELLLEKLSIYGANNLLLKWFRSYLSMTTFVGGSKFAKVGPKPIANTDPPGVHIC